MMIQLEMFREAEQWKQLLRQAGWRIVQEQNESLTVRHDRITDETEARQRLQQIGLLTSPHVRIRFVKDKRANSRRQLVKS